MRGAAAALLFLFIVITSACVGPSPSSSVTTEPGRVDAPTNTSLPPSSDNMPPPVAAPAPTPIKDFDFRSGSLAGPRAVLLRLAMYGDYACRAGTTFASVSEYGPYSRHILWLLEDGNRTRRGDAALGVTRSGYVMSDLSVDSRPTYDSLSKTVLGSHPFVNSTYDFPILPPEGPKTQPHEWLYLVAARNLSPHALDSIHIRIQCDEPFTIAQVKVGHRVHVEDHQTLHSKLTLGTALGAITVGGFLDAPTEHPYEMSVLTGMARVDARWQSGGTQRTWTSSPLGPGGLDYWDVHGEPGRHRLAIEGNGAFEVLVAGLGDVEGVQFLRAALQPPDPLLREPAPAGIPLLPAEQRLTNQLKLR